MKLGAPIRIRQSFGMVSCLGRPLGGVQSDDHGDGLTCPNEADVVVLQSECDGVSRNDVAMPGCAVPHGHQLQKRIHFGRGNITNGAIPGALHVTQLVRRAGELDATQPTVVSCAIGYRSVIAASWLSANGFADVSDLLGGYIGWAATQVLDPAWCHDRQQCRPNAESGARSPVNRPGMSGDSTSWEGWGHVRWLVEKVSAGAA